MIEYDYSKMEIEFRLHSVVESNIESHRNKEFSKFLIIKQMISSVPFIFFKHVSIYYKYIMICEDLVVLDKIIEFRPRKRSSQRQLVNKQLEVSGGATHLVKSKNSLRLDSVVVVFQVALSISVESAFRYLRCSGFPSTKISSSGVLGQIRYPP